MWYIYMIRCRNNSLYTGITTDVERRLKQHESGKGAKYLRGKAPLTLVFQKAVGSRSLASKVEIAIKSLSKKEKEQLLSEEGGEQWAQTTLKVGNNCTE